MIVNRGYLMKKFAAFLFLVLLAGVAQAEQRNSTNYTVIADVADDGGVRATSAAYTNDGSAGAVTGLSAAATPQEVMRDGYAGQLYDIIVLVLNSASSGSSVNETATLQLAAFEQLDDASFLAVDPSAVTWSVVGGPVTGISTVGLATTGTVYQDTDATVQGVFVGLTAQLSLTVLDTIPDNFGLYADDGIDDAWQVRYFGADNPQAASGVDADGTGQTNFFKFIAGLDPIDPSSRFDLRITPVPGQPGQISLTFGPVVSGRTYTVTAKSDLGAATWGSINASAPSDNGTERTIIDLSITGTAKFYRVEITKP